MPWHLNFGDNLNMPFLSIGNNIPYLILCIKATIFFIIVCLSRMVTYNRTISISAHLSESRVFFDLYSPALIFCQMPMKGVQLMHGHNIKISLHECYRKEMATNIEMHSSISIIGLIFNTYCRHSKNSSIFKGILSQ